MATAAALEVILSAKDRATPQLRRFEGGLKRVEGMAKMASVAIIASGAAIATVGAKAVMAASDLEESQNKVNVVFGASSQAVSDFAKTAASDLGIARAEALEAAGNFGNMLNTVGLLPAETAKMSNELVQLAADMASFNNQDPSEMLQKLASGLAGEAEPLRRFGVLLSENEVKLEAVRMGLAGTGQALTEAQKVQARYSLILKQSTVQHGDFARTSGGMANSMRILRAQLTDAAATVGAELLPVLVPLVKQLGEALPDAVKKVMPWVKDLVAGFSWFVENKPVLIAAIAAIGVTFVAALGPIGLVAAAISGVIILIGKLKRANDERALGEEVIQKAYAATTEEIDAAITALKGQLVVADAYTRANAHRMRAINDSNKAYQDQINILIELKKGILQSAIAAEQGEFQMMKSTKAIEAWLNRGRQWEEAQKQLNDRLANSVDPTTGLPGVTNATLEYADSVMAAVPAVLLLADAEDALADAQRKASRRRELERQYEGVDPNVLPVPEGGDPAAPSLFPRPRGQPRAGGGQQTPLITDAQTKALDAWRRATESVRDVQRQIVDLSNQEVRAKDLVTQARKNLLEVERHILAETAPMTAEIEALQSQVRHLDLIEAQSRLATDTNLSERDRLQLQIRIIQLQKAGFEAHAKATLDAAKKELADADAQLKAEEKVHDEARAALEAQLLFRQDEQALIEANMELARIGEERTMTNLLSRERTLLRIRDLEREIARIQGAPGVAATNVGAAATGATSTHHNNLTVNVEGSVVTERDLIEGVRTGLMRLEGRDGAVGIEGATPR